MNNWYKKKDKLQKKIIKFMTIRDKIIMRTN